MCCLCSYLGPPKVGPDYTNNLAAGTTSSARTASSSGATSSAPTDSSSGVTSSAPHGLLLRRGLLRRHNLFLRRDLLRSHSLLFRRDLLWAEEQHRHKCVKSGCRGKKGGQVARQ